MPAEVIAIDDSSSEYLCVVMTAHTHTTVREFQYSVCSDSASTPSSEGRIATTHHLLVVLRHRLGIGQLHDLPAGDGARH
jgi:hypothetical protein